jgi:phosphoserine phosphatase RsbU/P
VLKLASEGDAVTLAVHNGGAPIPPDLLPSIFEALARVAGERGRDSIGLGFIARAIVTAHRGEVTVRSSSEQGTTFMERLPRRDAVDSTVSEPRH